MPLGSLCGLLTLQVGVTVLSAVMFTLVGVILAANVFDYHTASGGWPTSLVLMLIFVLVLLVIGALMFGSSYSESRPLAMTALVLIVVLFCYWIILCCFSFVSNPDHVQAVCIDSRCPESFWIANLGFRRHLNITETKTNKTTIVTTSETTTTEKTRRKRSIEEILFYDYKYPQRSKRRSREEALNNLPNNFYYNNPIYMASTNDQNETTTTIIQEEESKYVFGFPFIGAIFLFVANLTFLIFCALVLWGWAAELDWADYYIEEEPVMVYEETGY